MKHSQIVFPLSILVLLILACGTVPATEPPASANFEPVTIEGTYEQHMDLKGGEAFTYVANKTDLTVTFTATSQADNTMRGTAQVIYIRSHQFDYEEEGYEPCHQLWSLEPITWTAELTGSIQHNPDGSLTVALIANPKDGPTFSHNFDCDGERSETPKFPYLTGVLVNGEYKHGAAYLPGPMQSGTNEEQIIMKVVP
jgi:hypothetical protein